MKGYLFLALTIISESIAIVFMKLSDGFRNTVQAAIALVAFACCYIFLTLALKSLPSGLANATWAGCSTILVAVAGMLFFKEHINAKQIVFIAMIVIGMVGYNYYEGR